MRGSKMNGDWNPHVDVITTGRRRTFDNVDVSLKQPCGGIFENQVVYLKMDDDMILDEDDDASLCASPSLVMEPDESRIRRAAGFQLGIISRRDGGESKEFLFL